MAKREDQPEINIGVQDIIDIYAGKVAELTTKLVLSEAKVASAETMLTNAAAQVKALEEQNASLVDQRDAAQAVIDALPRAASEEEIAAAFSRDSED